MPYKDPDKGRKAKLIYQSLHKNQHNASSRKSYQVHKQRAKAYREAHKEELEAYAKTYRQTNKERIRSYMQVYHELHKLTLRAYYREYFQQHKEQARISRRVSYQRQKLQTFERYGGPICKCCGERHLEFLSLDHINGDGAAHRRQIGNKPAHLYRWLKLHQYPPGFRVLCMNCNSALGSFGYCPHGNLQDTTETLRDANGRCPAKNTTCP